MDTWIFPLTILPGIGLIITSSTNWAVALTGEINQLLKDQHCDRSILRKKIEQLGLINRALVALYICATMCAFGGFVGAVGLVDTQGIQRTVNIVIGIGMAFLLAATTMLIIYAFRAVNIKRKQFLNRL